MSRVLFWILLASTMAGFSFAVAAPLATQEGTVRPPTHDDGGTTSSPSTASTTTAPGPAAVVNLSGMAPMPGDQRVPAKLLPPGSFDPDTGPSDVIFPPQNLTIRFNHKVHIAQGAKCETCHDGAKTSASVADHLTPKGTVCDSCHFTNHDNLNAVEPGDDEKGQCAFCHVGYDERRKNQVAPMELPRANMVFNHKVHAARNIKCEQCHGDVGNLELATRDQLPRMRGCFGCHAMADSASQGKAKSNCETCHVKAGSSIGGSIKTMFAQGVLKPPRWLHNAAHTPDFIDRHKFVAGNDSAFCANCHKEEFCVACHDGRVRPRTIHPNDYISMHPVEARMNMERCTSCHREQSFCLGCHQRVGVSMSGPMQVRNANRFHPPKDVWSEPPRKAGHHAFEAQRNLAACVGCHIERDCVVCHGGNGVGAGFNPHRTGFAAGCATQMRRNPRPCFACHLPDDGVLAQCR
jgi:hypothetical protein